MVESKYLTEELMDTAEAVRQFDAGVAAALAAIEGQACIPELILETFALAGEADFYMEHLGASVTLLPPAAGQEHFIETIKSGYTECDALLEVIELVPYLDEPAYSWDELQQTVKHIAQDIETKALWLGQSGFALSQPPYEDEDFETLHAVISGRDLLGWAHLATARRRVDGRLQGFDPQSIIGVTTHADLFIERVLMRLRVQGVRLPARLAPTEFFWCAGQYATDLDVTTEEIADKYAELIP